MIDHVGPERGLGHLSISQLALTSSDDEPVRRSEVFTGSGRRCHGLTPQQLFTWRRLARKPLEAVPASDAENGIKVIIYFTEHEQARVEGIMAKLGFPITGTATNFDHKSLSGEVRHLSHICARRSGKRLIVLESTRRFIVAT